MCTLSTTGLLDLEVEASLSLGNWKEAKSKQVFKCDVWFLFDSSLQNIGTSNHRKMVLYIYTLPKEFPELSRGEELHSMGI